MSKPLVAVLMGSANDMNVVEHCVKVLQDFAIPFEAKVLSAHRTPHDTVKYIHAAEDGGCLVFIAAAGLAAHLAGTVAAHTIRPVIGIPIDAGPLQGMDALLSTAQMPGGVPVACTAIGKHGAKNAAFLAIEILATHDATLAKKLLQYREQQLQTIRQQNDELQAALNS